MMKQLVYIFLLTGLLFGLNSCSQGEEQKIQTTTKATSSPPIPTPIQHEPYAIEDSSKIQVLDGGLKIYVVEKGSGPIPQSNQTLIAHYHGMLLNGKVFDSSFDRGTTSAFRLDQVIKGWTMGLTKVPVGSKVKLIIPPALAYGSADRPSIPANSTLIFDVQLVSVY